MLFNKCVTHSNTITGPNSYICIPVLKCNLMPVGKTLFDYESDIALGYENGLACKPIELLRLLYTTQKIMHEPSLGCGKSKLPEDLKSHCFCDENGKYPDMIDQYVEFLKKDGDVAGWRFHFFIQDPTFNFESGLTAFWAREAELKKKGSKKPKKEPDIHCLTSKTAWIDDGVSPYMGEMEDLSEAYSLPLGDMQNPICARKTLTFERSCELLDGHVDPCYLIYDNYFTSRPIVNKVNGGNSSPKSSVSASSSKSGHDDDVVVVQCAPQNQEDDEMDEDGNYIKVKSVSDSEDENSEGVESLCGDAQSDEDDEMETHEIGMDSNLMKVRFPRKAHPIPHILRNPNVLFALDLSKEPVDDDAITERDRSRARRQFKEAAQRAPELDDAMVKTAMAWCLEKHQAIACTTSKKLDELKEKYDMLRKKVQDGDDDDMDVEEGYIEDIDADTKAEKFRKLDEKHDKEEAKVMKDELILKNALLKSKEFLDLYRSVLHNDHKNTGGKSKNIWFEQQRRDVTDFSVVPETQGCMDKTLSEFGNTAAREIYIMEMVCGISVLHPELFLIMLMTLIAPDIEFPMLRFHLLLTGPPAAGKTFLQGMLARLSAPNTIRQVSTQSRMANTTGEVVNGMMICMDELPPMFTDKGDGSGISDLKETLGNGIVFSERAGKDEETGKISMVKYVSEKKSPHLANTNIPVSLLMEAIRDRFGIINTPIQNRPEVDQVMENYKMKNDPERIKQLDGLQFRWGSMQALSNRIFTLIRIRAIPDIDMKMVFKISSLTFRFLKKDMGTDVSLRNRERVMMLTRAVTIYDALSKVFFSGTVFAPKHKFEDVDILECLPYLTSTREHFYFALSLLHNFIVDPSLNIILTAIKNIVDAEKVEKIKFSTMIGTDNKTATDYNYYSIPVSSQADISDCLNAVGRRLTQCVQGTTPHELSADSVCDLLRWLVGQKMTYNQYDAENKKTGLRRSMDICRIKRGAAGFGLEISREYVDTMVNQKIDVVQMAIKHTFDPHMDIKRIVTGQTYRYGVDDPTSPHANKSFPFLFKCIDVDDKEKVKSLRLDQDNHTRFAHNLILYNQKSQARTERTELVTENLEEMQCAEWYAKVGAPRIFNEVENQTSVGSYPTDFMGGYVDEFPDGELSLTNESTHKKQKMDDNLDEEGKLQVWGDIAPGVVDLQQDEQEFF